MSKPSSFNKIHRFLDEFFVVDYACYGADKLPEGKLDLYFDRCDKKVYVYQGDIVYGSLKLNEMEQKYIFAILSSGMNLLECSRVPSDDKTPMDQKFKVGLWMKCLPFGCIDKDKGIDITAKKGDRKSDVKITIYRDRVEEEGVRIKAEDINKYDLTNANHSLSFVLDEKELHKVECTCCTIQKIQDLLKLFNECCDSNNSGCC